MSRTEIIASAIGQWSVAVTDCSAIPDELEHVLTGWQLSRITAQDGGKADVRIRKIAGGFSWKSACLPRPKQWDEIPPRTVMNVVSDIHDVLFDWFLLRNPSFPCLHAGAVKMGGKLVCFPSVRSSGKSSLCLELVAAGHELFCDDVLPVLPETLEGLAMGIAPMVRLPLPKKYPARLREFIQARRGLSSPDWSYMRLVGNEIAPFGERAEIRQLVLLARGRRGVARLTQISPAEMLRELILQNFGSRSDAGIVLETLHSLVRKVSCFRLAYTDLREARQLLERQIGQETS